MRTKELFGTDGIRGTANQFPITIDVITRVGQALGYMLLQSPSPNKSGRRKVVIGKDTRLSGYMVEMALASGLNSMGVDVQLLGPLPTPGIGFLTRNMRADAGVVISASHNPFKDNGIKIFGPDGFKISSEQEKQIEKLVLEADINKLLPSSDKIGRTKRIDDAAGRYIVYVKNTFPLNHTLDGMRVVLDCGNGAAYKVGPAIFEELGAEVFIIGNTPNGINIKSLDDAGLFLITELSKTFEKSMVLLFKAGTLEPWKWSQNWTRDAHRNAAIDLSGPSVFRIVSETKTPYHGYVVPNNINDAFFTTWNRTQTPEHLTLVPIILDKKLTGMMLGICSKTKAKDIKLQNYERLGSKAGDLLVKWGPSKAA